MKTTSALLVMLALAAVVALPLPRGPATRVLPALAQTEAPSTWTVGGGQFGPWRTGMPAGQLRRIWAKLFGGWVTTRRVSLISGSMECWRDNAACFFSNRTGVVAIVLRSMPPGQRYETAAGVTLGSPLDAVWDAYGRFDQNWTIHRSRVSVSIAMTWAAPAVYIEVTNGRVTALGTGDFTFPWWECFGDPQLQGGVC